ncbi:hypothetical protein GII33_09035 [Gordonia pseudamarae]|uniref:hypothetical protein n=1 Tax=Gordonia TaxID=2053 RepID=UPI0019849A19|nr:MULTISPECIES: hypothetical protein [Gordonia]MBD0021074.1 hypothetical protein [Gordonia sp. (in: high G+C Gram-positive bacteria)]QHN26088.1 hypothetical protein GII33_09035 [Gordonia pseudamarae]
MTTTAAADRNAAILDAYAALTSENGRRPGVRALRERAGVSTNAAAAWLKTHAPATVSAPEVPEDQLSSLLKPLWAAAVAAASEDTAEAHAAEVAALTEAETHALARADEAEARVAELEQRIAELETEHAARVAELTSAVEQAESRIAAAEQAAATAQASVNAARTEAGAAVQQAEQRAIAAEKAQASAEAVAETLRVVVAGFQQAAGNSAAATA